MSEFKVNIDEDKGEDELVSYTLREIPRKDVHNKIISFQKEIAYKRDRKYNIEQTYVEALKDWAATRPEPQKSVA